MYGIFNSHRQLLLIISCCLLFSYSTSSGQNTFWYDFKGTAKLQINYTNSPGGKTWSLFTNKIFPDQETRLRDTIPAGHGSREYSLSVSWPQKVTLSVPGKELNLLLIPGSTLICHLDLKNPEKISFEATDSLADINEYLVKKDFSVARSFKMRRTLAVQGAATLKELRTTMDQLYREELQFFRNSSEKLPQWYQNYEYWENRYADAMVRMNALPQRELSQNAKEPIPTGYFGFLDSLAVNNAAAKSCNSYYFFLYELFNKRMNDHDRVHGTTSDFLDYQIKQANKELSGDVADLFKAFSIQLVFNHYKKDVARSFIKNNDSIFTNNVWLEELKNYFKSKENRAGKGKTPPNFALADLKDSLISLGSLKGNVIVLSFWFAGCRPCVEEFPAENAMAEKFRDQSVRFVSVCVNTSEIHWQQWSKRFGLKTINLWANPQWEKTIVENYDLTVFPKYVLINKEYLIVETNADRPTQGLEKQINSLLKK